MRRTLAIAVASAVLSVSCTGGGPTVQTFCGQISEMQSVDEQLMTVDLSNGDAVVAALVQFRDQFEAMAEASPEDIREDAEIAARYGVALANAALAADPDDPFDRAGVLAAAAASEPDIEEVLGRLATYSARNCTVAP